MSNFYIFHFVKIVELKLNNTASGSQRIILEVTCESIPQKKSGRFFFEIVVIAVKS